MKSMAISGNENDERKESVRYSETTVGLTDNPLFY